MLKLKMDFTADLKTYCKSAGADLVGIADLELLKNKLPLVPSDLLEPYTYAVSIGIGLSSRIIETITDAPSGEYATHCKDINVILNRITSNIADWISNKKYRSLAIPASLKVDDTNLLGNISHKAVARIAGLGWQGKSLLLVSPEFGPRLRLSTILTDIPLTPDAPLKNRCGKCTECTMACPASAIKNTSTDSNYSTREEAIDLDKCHSKLLEFQAIPEIGYTFCGVCIRVCPFGKIKSQNK